MFLFMLIFESKKSSKHMIVRCDIFFHIFFDFNFLEVTFFVLKVCEFTYKFDSSLIVSVQSRLSTGMGFAIHDLVPRSGWEH